jgi:hypothetical protein
LVQGHFASLCLNLYAPVFEVANPARKAKVDGSLSATLSESHPLHAAFDEKSPAFFQWLLSLTRGLYETVAICVATVSRAARHRHEIVEELAQ